MSNPALLNEYIAKGRGLIDDSLSQYTLFDSNCPERLRDAIRYSLLAPGKRLRPLLVLMAAEACGSTVDAALPAACAVEMIHTYSLIHDDLPAMDDDDLRRGRPTCHRQFDEATAILAGDALLTLAFEVLAREIHPGDVAAACCAALARAAGASQMVGGQADDLAGEFSGGGVEQLEAIHRRKTGAMIRVSLELGALVAVAGPQQRAALEKYGERLGLAFQIADDLLDVSGSEAATGKRVGKDAELGKLTFPSLIGVEASRNRAEALVAEACALLAPFGEKGAPLQSVARYVLDRTS